MSQAALLAFARAAGLVSRAPGFSHPSVPPIVRVGIALGLAFCVASSLPRVPELGLVPFTIAIAGNALVGGAIGFGAALLYDGAYFAGRTIDDYLGVRGSVPNASVTSAQAFGRLWSSLFLAAFLLLDGWVPVVFAFSGSFAHVGLTAFPDRGAWLAFGLVLPATILRAALLVAAPAIAVAAALQLALAAVARVVPRCSTFMLAFPVTFAAVLLVTIAAVPLLAPAGAHPRLVLPWGHAP